VTARRPFAVCDHGSQRRKCADCQRDVMEQVLDAAEGYLRMGDTQNALKVIFVWSQRGTYLLNGAETWEEQRV